LPQRTQPEHGPEVPSCTPNPQPVPHSLIMLNGIKKYWFKGIIVNALVIITFFKIFWGLGSAPLQRWDEQTNVNVVQTTLSSGNWLNLKCKDTCSDDRPHDEAIPFLEKPPLWYWLTMGSVTIFGENKTVYRFVSAFSGFLLVMLLYFLSSMWYGFPAGIATIVTMLTTRHLFMSGATFTTHSLRTADLDSLQLLLIILSLFFFWRAQQRINFTAHKIKSETLFLLLAITTSTLAYFTKGPLGFLPIVIFMLYFIINTTAALFKDGPTGHALSKKTTGFLKNSTVEVAKIILLIAAVLTLLIAPWYLYQYNQFSTIFIENHFLYHLVRRTCEPLEGHHGNWRFYLNIFFNLKIFLMGIPVAIALFATVTGLFDKLNNKKNAPRTGMRWWEDFRIFSIISGFVISFAIITTVQTKLMWYIFYVYPFAALIAGILTANLITAYQNRRRVG